MTWVLWWMGAALAGPSIDVALQAVPDVSRASGVVIPHGAPVRSDLGTRGAVVHLYPERAGLRVEPPILVRLDATGQPVAVHRPERPGQWVDGTPLAVERAIQATRIGGGAPAARLAWQPVGGQMRQVWTVTFVSGAPGTGLQVPEARIDALSGAVLELREAGHTTGAPPLADVFVANPVVDAEPTRVGLPFAEAGLSDLRLEVRQCHDLGEFDTFVIDDVEVDLRKCTEVDAAGPVDGNYLHEPVPYSEDPARDEDDFAAAHVYWNTHQALDWFEATGWVPASDFDPRLEVVVNRRVTDPWDEVTAGDPASALVPYNNAYFTGGYETWEGDWVAPRTVYGQGTEVDFAYDADVVHHELGHFVWRSQDGPYFSDDTEHGPSIVTSSLNEGFADYLSSAIQEDPALAEYASGDRGVIRDLKGSLICGRDSYGEPHFDGLIAAQALWSVREELAVEQQRLLDAVVIDVISVLPEWLTWERASQTLIDVGTNADPAIGSALQAELDARGLTDCDPVIDVTVGSGPFRPYSTVPPASQYSTASRIPGYVQFRVEVPEDSPGLILRLSQTKYLGLDLYGNNTPEPLQLVGRKNKPLTWSTEPVETTVEIDGEEYVFMVDDWILEGKELGEVAQVEVVPHPDDDRYELYRYELPLDLAPGTWTLQLVNTHDRSATALDLRLDEIEVPPEPIGPLPPQSIKPVAEGPSACGCAQGSSTSLWLLPVLVGLAARRRTDLKNP